MSMSKIRVRTEISALWFQDVSKITAYYLKLENQKYLVLTKEGTRARLDTKAKSPYTPPPFKPVYKSLLTSTIVISLILSEFSRAQG
ncbi:hypothetical protein CANTEDRAFT_114677 [Yamadazyma tenuis ATCC 10573]|uniref:Uncharacterized protein n=1 Tax=Candida tenuis (strain ATCC 10573 / BCRC 21748 / CBS 615 / JCM 9827 / NBRC 10315 / NRRL Y-1498 / VKM Y-70) TaxID=590646 RepID=G3B633_CANTC|nr:uncharacterized protein CANTEDRAFT_114677 [Yamadazyma tenuis ATCC 10573]EGV63368.1 hypothetical protein CANTEDRAFT_114677 [Yamadazyma tenuis ATCC 10573]